MMPGGRVEVEFLHSDIIRGFLKIFFSKAKWYRKQIFNLFEASLGCVDSNWFQIIILGVGWGHIRQGVELFYIRIHASIKETFFSKTNWHNKLRF